MREKRGIDERKIAIKNAERSRIEAFFGKKNGASESFSLAFAVLRPPAAPRFSFCFFSLSHLSLHHHHHPSLAGRRPRRGGPRRHRQDLRQEVLAEGRALGRDRRRRRHLGRPAGHHARRGHGRLALPGLAGPGHAERGDVLGGVPLERVALDEQHRGRLLHLAGLPRQARDPRREELPRPAQDQGAAHPRHLGWQGPG